MRKRAPSPAIVALGLALLFCAGMACLCIRPSDAGWIAVDGFTGTITHRNPGVLGYEYARSSVGWLYRSGEMHRLGMWKRNTKPVQNVGISALLKSPVEKELLVGIGTGLSQYQMTADTLIAMESDTMATVSWDFAVCDSLIVRMGEYYDPVAGPDSLSWLKLVLTDLRAASTAGQTYSVTWYTNSIAHAGVEMPGDSFNQTMYYPGVSLSSRYGRINSFVSDGVMYMTDGRYRVTYAGSPSSGWTYPEMHDSVAHLDSVSRYSPGTGALSDSCFLYANWLLANGNAVRTSIEHILIDDDSYTGGTRGLPVRPVTMLETGTARARLLVHMDSLLWLNHSVYDDGAWALIYKHIGNHSWYPLTFVGKWSGYYVWDTSLGATHYATFYPTALNADGSNWHARSMDAQLYCFNIHEQGMDKGAQGKIINVGDSLALSLWGYGLYSGSGYKALNVRRQPLIEHGGTDAYTAFGYRVSLLHRQRAYYACNPGDPTAIAWSEIGNYTTLDGTEPLEGDDPITGLASDQGQVVIFRRHSIMTLSGFAETDFFLVPAPTGVGAVNDACIVRNSKDNAIYFPNEQGLWAYAGGAVSEVPTGCYEIFADSINWDAAGLRARAAIFKETLFLTCPFGEASENNRFLAVDLESKSVGFLGWANISEILTFRDEFGKERMFLGDADSTVIYEVLSDSNQMPLSANRKSGWDDFDAPDHIKTLFRYALSVEGNANDTVIVDFYANDADSVIWSDTTVLASAGLARWTSFVSRDVCGYTLSYGFQTPNLGVRILAFDWDVAARERVGPQ